MVIPAIARIVGTLVFASGDIWAGVAWAWETRLNLLEQLGPPEYAAFITLCTGAMMAINWPWINRLRPSVRFAALVDDLKSALRTFGPLNDDRFLLDPMVKYERECLAEKLAALGIATPDVNDSRAWADLLPKLLLDAQFGRIKKARQRGIGQS